MKGPGASALSAVLHRKGANGGMPIYPLSNSCPHLSLWLFRSKDVNNVNRRQRFAPVLICFLSFFSFIFFGGGGHVYKNDYPSVNLVTFSPPQYSTCIHGIVTIVCITQILSNG